ncbi:MAG: response regulator transcription factor [Ignavibacteriales bacterium]|nr:response regulator transcription factor [Ignavibacteriales bacterium]
MKILIVDDNAGMREMIRMQVCTDDDNVIECSDGAEAVALFNQFHPDLILMDIEMKPMDGFTAAEKIFERDRNAKVVFVTDHNTSAFRTKAKKLHAVGFVSKENLHEIKNIIQQ